LVVTDAILFWPVGTLMRRWLNEQIGHVKFVAGDADQSEQGVPWA
jgi:hypothetical protein